MSDMNVERARRVKVEVGSQGPPETELERSLRESFTLGRRAQDAGATFPAPRRVRSLAAGAVPEHEGLRVQDRRLRVRDLPDQ